MIVYMLAFAIASLSAIAIDDLNLGRNPNVSLAHSMSFKNKISRNIRHLRATVYLQKKRLKRS